MLGEFIVSHREAIIANARARVGARTSPRPTDTELTNGIPLFLDQLGDALRLAKSTTVVDHAALSASAGKHGSDLLGRGFTVGQVVHDYGDICQSITELAVELRAPLSGGDFRILNLCLDDAIAGAVTEYARQRERAIQSEGTERLGVLAHELRNVVSTVTLAYATLSTGQVAIGGSTGQLLGRSLLRLTSLIDRSLADVRLDAGIGRLEPISVAGFLEEIEIGASLQAQAQGIHFTAPPVASVLMIEGDRQVLIAAVANMLQNAFKFTGKGGNVSLTTRVTAERVLFDIEDGCGGLPPGKIEELFTPFSQRGTDLSGVGLGLSICLKAAKASAGEIHVKDLPGKGCIFTLDLPRKPPPPLSVIGGGKDAPSKGGEAAPVTSAGGKGRAG
jgi:signal transduction histidine kinase